MRSSSQFISSSIIIIYRVTSSTKKKRTWWKSTCLFSKPLFSPFISRPRQLRRNYIIVTDRSSLSITKSFSLLKNSYNFAKLLSSAELLFLRKFIVCVIRCIESICIPAQKEENIEGYLNWVKTIHARFNAARSATRNSQCYERPRKIPVT